MHHQPKHNLNLFFSLNFLQHVLLSLQSGKNFNYPRFEFWPFDSENEKKSTISLKNIVKLEITDHSIGSGGQVVSRVRVPSPGFDSRNFQTCLQEPSVLKKMLWKRMEEQWLQLLCLTGLNKQSLRAKN